MILVFYLTNDHYAPLKRHKKLPLKKCALGFIDQSDDAKIFIFLKDRRIASQILVELSWRPNFVLITIDQPVESIRRSALRKQTSLSSFLEHYAVRPHLDRPDIISRVHILKMNPVACPNQKSKTIGKSPYDNFSTKIAILNLYRKFG
jgi:hypothetical protein